ncbi:MAG: DUF4242 domain-containing protein [Croceitalea sp.]|nr:DUF4242 domain-containing protein [Croceitalea sp.]
MPLYMDRHDIPDEITAKHVALMHQEDLKIQHLYGCKGMTYWCDSERHTAFCLIEAPNKAALQDMHNHAHGSYPHEIIEVDARIVESFLGRIEDPIKAAKENLNIIDDPAFRAIMVLEAGDPVHSSNAEQMDLFYQKFHRSITKTLRHFKGSIVKQNKSTYLVSFTNSTNAILCALKIQNDFKYITPKLDGPHRSLGIGISAGVPVTGQEGIFAETIERATQLCEVVHDTIAITEAVKNLYENENRQAKIDPNLIRTLRPKETHFLSQLMAFCKKNWNKDHFKLAALASELGYSKAQLYRNIKKLTGKSPNAFMREYRLHKALELLHQHFGNIAEVAYETGFNSPAYFSKCFLETYGILPSKYAQLNEH